MNVGILGSYGRSRDPPLAHDEETQLLLGLRRAHLSGEVAPDERWSAGARRRISVKTTPWCVSLSRSQARVDLPPNSFIVCQADVSIVTWRRCRRRPRMPPST